MIILCLLIPLVGRGEMQGRAFVQSKAVSQLASADPITRRNSLYVLGRLHTRIAIDNLRHVAIHDPDEDTRVVAINLLGTTTHFREGVVRTLTAVMLDPKSFPDYCPNCFITLSFRSEHSPGCEAAIAMVRIGPDSIPSLIDVANDVKADLRSRMVAMQCLGSMASAAASRIQRLSNLIYDPTPGIQVAAVRMLVAIDAKSITVHRLLYSALASSSSLVRVNAAGHIYAITHDSAVAAAVLIKELDCDDEEACYQSLYYLGDMGRLAHHAKDRIVCKLGSKSSLVRIAALNALSNIVTRNDPEMELIRHAVEDNEEAVRDAAKLIIANMEMNKGSKK